MKKQFLFVFYILFSVALAAQSNGYKKYVLLEHFTNTRCGICGNSNPAFYTRWSAFPDDIHHISFHPNFPYPNCAINQSNPTENNKRATFYNVPATPYVLKNGKQGSSAGSTSTTVLNSLVGGTSPLLVQVQESGTMQRSLKVEIFSHPNLTLPTEGLKLYVAAVEKTYNYNAPNGETVHHNVFRTMIVDGQDISVAAAAGSIQLDFNYGIQSTWVEGEMYAMAWVQGAASKEVYNSGSSLDAVFTNTVKTFVATPKLGPNPVQSALNINFDEAAEGSVEVFDLVGKKLKSLEFSTNQLWTIDFSDVKVGIYLVRVQTQSGILTRRIVVSR